MLRIVSIHDPLSIEKALTVLREEGTIIYPTETCYGLGCDARSAKAVENVFKIKVRESGKPVLVLVHDVSVAMRYVEWNETIDELARTYWPGPLTIVANIQPRYRAELAPGVIGSDDTLAFRVTNHPYAVACAKNLNAPLVSTSANISSYANPYDIRYITEMFDGQEHVPDLIIDAGNLAHHSPSTVVRVGEDGSKIILRQGEIILND